MNSKLFALATAIIMSSAVVSPVFAVERNGAVKAAVEARKEAVKDLRETIREEVASKVGEIKRFLGVRTTLARATIQSINGTALTVQKDGKTYTIATGKFDKCSTQFRRRFWGNGNLDEMSVGDSVNIFGMWTDENQTSVNACLIRDVSIQKRFGVFFGEVKSVSASGFVMTTVSDKRADQTVTVSSSTKLVNRKEQSMSAGDIQVGHKVRVRGLWDNQSNTITEVVHIKDFTLPIVSTPASNQ